MAQTNVQAFSGDVEISSNLTAASSKFSLDTNGTLKQFGNSNSNYIKLMKYFQSASNWKIATGSYLGTSYQWLSIRAKMTRLNQDVETSQFNYFGSSGNSRVRNSIVIGGGGSATQPNEIKVYNKEIDSTYEIYLQIDSATSVEVEITHRNSTIDDDYSTVATANNGAIDETGLTKIYDSGTTTDLRLISGNVGIGTTDPGGLFDVSNYLIVRTDGIVRGTNSLRAESDADHDVTARYFPVNGNFPDHTLSLLYQNTRSTGAGPGINFSGSYHATEEYMTTYGTIKCAAGSLSNGVVGYDANFRFYLNDLTNDGVREVFTIMGNTGNVGIATTSPGAPFEVRGAELSGQPNGTTGILSRHVAGVDGVLNIFGIQASNGEETLGLQTQIDGRAWQSDIDGGWSYGTDGRYHLSLQPYKGRVGIGTTSPSYVLHVHGSSSNQNSAPDNSTDAGLIVLRNTKTGSSAYSMALGVDQTSGVGYLNAGGNSTVQPICINTRGGNLGIGRIDPGAKIDVYSGDIKMSQNNSYAADRFLYTHWSDSNNDHQIGMKFDYYTGSGGTGPEHSALHFVSNAGRDQAINGPSARTMMTIRSVGTIGINQNTPLYTLDVTGTIRCGTNGRMLNSYVSVPYGAWVDIPLGGRRGSYIILAAGTSNDQACAIFTACANSNNNAGSISTQQSNNDYNRNSYIDRRYAANINPQLIISGSQGYTRTCSVTTIVV
jgi:hypothetical protein